MEPNLNDGDMVLIETITPKFNKYNRFDLVVVKYTSPKYIIKRIIGLPNETIKYINNNLYVDDILYTEDFESSGIIEDFEILVPENKYFIMGDNREESKDSRDFGAIEENEIIGKPIFKFWPIKELKIVK
jgi:signal peptidase I